MYQTIVKCPHCGSIEIKKNGKKCVGKHQNYFCKSCGKQFILDCDRSYLGTRLGIVSKIKRMLSRGCSITDISEIEQISLGKVLSVVKSLNYDIHPQQTHYETLEVDELWSYVKNKKNKKWIIYAYHRQTGEIVAWVHGKRDARTANKLRKKLRKLGVTYTTIATDDWSSFKTTFKNDNHLIGKKFTVGIEGNNCRIRHLMRRLFRKTCCFSKKEENHWNIFQLTVHYINFGYV